MPCKPHVLPCHKVVNVLPYVILIVGKMQPIFGGKHFADFFITVEIILVADGFTVIVHTVETMWQCGCSLSVCRTTIYCVSAIPILSYSYGLSAT